MRASALVALLLAACGPSSEDDASVRSTSQAIQGEQSLAFSFKLPTGLVPEDVSASSVGLLKVGDRALVTGISVSSTGKVEIRNDAKTGTVFAKQNIQLLDRAKVSGNATAGGVVQLGNGAVVTGTKTNGANLSFKEFSWTATSPQASQGNISLEPDTSRVLAPNTYGNLTVKSRAKLSLEAGVYVFNTVLIEPQAKLLIDSTLGPVQVYVKTGLTFRGSIVPETTGIPRVLFGYTGPQTALIEAPFTGALIAPAAEVRFQAALPKGHNAFIHAKSLVLEPDTKLTPFAFDWVSIVGPDAYKVPPATTAVQPMPASPANEWVVYDGTGNNVVSQTVTLGSPLTFSLPASYPVQGGVIGNGHVDFTFQTSGSSVTCTYVGGSSTSSPANQSELTKGMQLTFQSCSDGLPPTTVRTATSYTLVVTAIPGYPVSITPPVTRDGHCSEEIELLSAAQTYQMVSTFNWNTKTKVAEVDAQNRPTLYPAWIYIRDKDDLRALRQLYIHVLKQPLFTEELQALAGRCGALTNHGDGAGAFVSALIPGKTYNKLIDVLTAPNISGDRVIFDAVILRTVPLAARTPQGSIKLETLADAGFRYLDYEKDPFRAPADFEQDLGIAQAIAGAVEWIAQAVRDVGQWFDTALADIAKVTSGRVRVTLAVHSITQDPAFGPNAIATRAWGVYGGFPLTANGMEARVVQTSTTAQPFGIVSAVSQGITDRLGHATMDIVAGTGLQVGFCLELGSTAAKVTDFLLPTTICDLRGLGTAVQQLPLTNLVTHQQLLVEIDNPRVSGLFQADDAWWWANDVLKFNPPRQAKIMSGWHADSFSRSKDGTTKLLYTPCLGYPNNLSDAGTAAAMLGGGFAGGAFIGGPVGGLVGSVVAGVYAAVILTSDIVMPLNSSLPRSREVMSHEFGHFLFCSMMHHTNPGAISELVEQTITNAGADLAFPVRYINEAVADFITGQVVGANDYTWARGVDSTRYYCVPPTDGACVGGSNAGGACTGELDCPGSVCAHPPAPPAPLSHACSGGTNSGDPCVVANAATQCPGGTCDPTPTTLPSGYCFDETFRSHTMAPGGEESIARLATLLHDVFDGGGHGHRANDPSDADMWTTSPGGGAPLQFSPYGFSNTDSNIEQVALPGTALPELIGIFTWDPIQPFGQTLTDKGLHRAINTVMEDHGVNWCDRCEVLALHSELTANETAPHLHSVCLADPALADIGAPPVPLDRMDHATCAECPPGLAADEDGKCADVCPADLVLDGATMSLDSTEIATSSLTAPGDSCPSVFVVRIENFGALAARGAVTSVDVDVVVSPENAATCEQTYGLRQKVTVAGTTTSSDLSGTGTFVTCGPTPLCVESCNGLPSSTVAPDEADVLEYSIPVDSSVLIKIHPHVGVQK